MTKLINCIRNCSHGLMTLISRNNLIITATKYNVSMHNTFFQQTTIEIIQFIRSGMPSLNLVEIGFSFSTVCG